MVDDLVFDEVQLVSYVLGPLSLYGELVFRC